MKDDPFFGESTIFQEPKSLVWEAILPAIFLGLVVVVDVFWVPWVTMTPLACAVMISWMALKYRPTIVASWAMIFVCVTGSLLFYDTQFVKTAQVPELTAVLRTISAAVTAAMAIAISVYRSSLNRSYQQVITVLEKMPVPIIVSDESGTINFINDQAAELLGVTIEEAPGHSYFSFLVNQSEKGKSIERYLQIFDSNDDEGLKLRIHLRRHPNKLMSGMLMGLGRGSERRLVTVILEGPEIHRGSTMPFMR